MTTLQKINSVTSNRNLRIDHLSVNTLYFLIINCIIFQNAFLRLKNLKHILSEAKRSRILGKQYRFNKQLRAKSISISDIIYNTYRYILELT